MPDWYMVELTETPTATPSCIGEMTDKYARYGNQPTIPEPQDTAMGWRVWVWGEDEEDAITVARYWELNQ